MPKISIIVPCFNCERYLSYSLDSILNQSFFDTEVIIIDDCSTDNTRNIINGYKDSRIIIMRNQYNSGPATTRNRGMKIAKGEYIAFCDGDDLWEKDKLYMQYELLNKNKEFDIAYSDSRIINEKGEFNGYNFSDLFKGERNRTGDIFLLLCKTNFINTPTVMMRKSCVEKAGYFPENFRYLEDWIYWIKLAYSFKYLYSPEKFAQYRIHSNSTNKDKVGYKHARINACKYILSSFKTKLPHQTKSDILYLMAREHQQNNNDEARKIYKESIRENIFNIRSTLNLILTYFQ